MDKINKIRRRFRAWRKEVDSEYLLDTYDLALGYFSGTGLDHDTATLLAAGEDARPLVRIFLEAPSEKP